MHFDAMLQDLCVFVLLRLNIDRERDFSIHMWNARDLGRFFNLMTAIWKSIKLNWRWEKTTGGCTLNNNPDLIRHIKVYWRSKCDVVRGCWKLATSRVSFFISFVQFFYAFRWVGDENSIFCFFIANLRQSELHTQWK